MEFRHLGRSGLKVSEISYGNWITHGSQVEEEQATACVRAALELGITTFDSADVVRSGKALYIGVSEWKASEIRAAYDLARQLRVPLVSNQPQYSMLWRVIEAEVVPTSDELGIGQIVWSPIAQGVLTGKYQPGQPAPAGSPATADKSGAHFIAPWLSDEVLTPVQ